jgi:hypothetical protein
LPYLYPAKEVLPELPEEERPVTPLTLALAVDRSGAPPQAHAVIIERAVSDKTLLRALRQNLRVGLFCFLAAPP